MGWRVRFNGGPDDFASLAADSAHDGTHLEFEKDVVYELRPAQVRDLLASYPDSFERVYSDDAAFSSPEPPPVVTLDAAPQEAKPVLLRVLRDMDLPGEEPRPVHKGEQMSVHPDIAADLIAREPGLFKIVSDE